MRYSFSKEERLCSQILIEALFDRGSAAMAYPFRVVWLETDLPAKVPLQVAFTVPKKRFRRAVDRNRIKRLMREVYRLNKPQLYKQLPDRQFALMVIYVGKEEFSFDRLNESWKKFIERFPPLSSPAMK